jgi:hypothetical protein
MTEESAKSEFQAAIAAGGVEALEALRDHAAAALESTASVRDKAPIIRRLQQLLDEIERHRPRVRGDAIDQLQQRRKDRRRGVGR